MYQGLYGDSSCLAGHRQSVSASPHCMNRDRPGSPSSHDELGKSVDCSRHFPSRRARSHHLSCARASVFHRGRGERRYEMHEGFRTMGVGAAGALPTLSRIDGAVLHRIVVLGSHGRSAGSVLALCKLWRMARSDDPIQPPPETSYRIHLNGIRATVSPTSLEAVSIRIRSVKLSDTMKLGVCRVPACGAGER